MNDQQNDTLQELLKELEAVKKREKEIAIQIRTLYQKAGIKL
jgi:hypothetical protein